MPKLNTKMWYYPQSYKLAEYQVKEFIKYMSLNLNGIYLLAKDHDEIDKLVWYT